MTHGTCLNCGAVLALGGGYLCDVCRADPRRGEDPFPGHKQTLIFDLLEEGEERARITNIVDSLGVAQYNTLRAVMLFPGSTPAELAEHFELLEVRERLSELARLGAVISPRDRHCHVCGKMNPVWVPTAAGVASYQKRKEADRQKQTSDE